MIQPFVIRFCAFVEWIPKTTRVIRGPQGFEGGGKKIGIFKAICIGLDVPLFQLQAEIGCASSLLVMNVISNDAYVEAP